MLAISRRGEKEYAAVLKTAIERYVGSIPTVGTDQNKEPKMEEEFAGVLGWMQMTTKKILELLDNPTDPYLLSNVRRALGSLETETSCCTSRIDREVKRLGYTWENTYSPEARARNR